MVSARNDADSLARSSASNRLYKVLVSKSTCKTKGELPKEGKEREREARLLRLRLALPTARFLGQTTGISHGIRLRPGRRPETHPTGQRSTR